MFAGATRRMCLTIASPRPCQKDPSRPYARVYSSKPPVLGGATACCMPPTAHLSTSGYDAVVAHATGLLKLLLLLRVCCCCCLCATLVCCCIVLSHIASITSHHAPAQDSTVQHVKLAMIWRAWSLLGTEFRSSTFPDLYARKAAQNRNL